MLIYFNGDSFTAGSGLFYSSLPEWPGHFDNFQNNNKQKEITNFLKAADKFDKTKFVDYQSVTNGLGNFKFFDLPTQGCLEFWRVKTEVERHYAYPSKLNKLDKSIEVINSAYGGASMGGICFRTILDLLNLKDEGKKIDFVVIQLTSLERYEIFDSDYQGFIYDMPLGSFKNGLEQNISSAILLKYTDENYLFKYLYHLCSIKETVYSITGKMPIIIDSCNGAYIAKRIAQTKELFKDDSIKSSFFEKLLKNSMIETAHLHFMKDIADVTVKPSIWDGHYQEEVHEVAAQKIYKLLSEVNK